MDIEEEDYNKPIKSNDGGGGWDNIRQLDDEENWCERNSVISKHDHLFHTECAQVFVNDIVSKVPAIQRSSSNFDEPIGSSGSYLPPPSPYKEAIPPVHNISNSPPPLSPSPPAESIDYLPPSSHQSINNPKNTSSTDYDYMKEFGDEEFQTTSDQFDMDYLERVTAHSNPQATSALARESLFVKFDPLVNRNSPCPIKPLQMKPHPQINSEYHDGNLLMLSTPPSHSQVTYSNNHQESNNLVIQQQLNMTPDHSATPRSKRESSPHTRSLFDTSPATLQQRQLQVSPSTGSTMNPQEDELVKVLIYSEADLRNIVHQVRNECEIQNEETISLIKMDHVEELSKQQKIIDRLIRETQNMKAHIAVGRTAKIIETEQNQDYQELCSKYRETEMEIMDAYEQLKNEAKRVEEERDQSLRDFASLERSFTDFHQRYNKSKELVTSLQKTVAELQDHNKKNEILMKKIKIQNSKLQEDTFSKLQEANETFEQLKKESASEVAVMKANTKKMTVQLASLERQLEQKEQEKLELTQICEDLMKELSNKS